MIIAVILLSAAVLCLAAALILYRRQIRDIEKQLRSQAGRETNARITAFLPSREISGLCAAINGVSDNAREERIRSGRSDRAFRESVTSIAHDLRTPLTSAIGYLNMAKSAELTPEKRAEYLDRIAARIDMVNKLLEQLFEYTRIEGGEYPLEITRVNINNLLRDRISAFYDDFLSLGMETEFYIPERAMFVAADKEALSRVFGNIIANALRYGKDYFSVRAAGEGGRFTVRFTNGSDLIGEEDIESIFDRFYTTDKSRSRKTTGLGLSIAKRFVELQGGEISADYRDGAFSITVSFPIKD